MGSKNELIVMTLRHEEVPTFFADLEKIISALQGVGETYMPIGIVSNSMHPETEVLVFMRTIQKIHNFPENGWRTSDPKEIKKRFTL